MAATTITTETRKLFVFLFDLGVEYFNTCIAGDPREAARSLEYDPSVYHALHAKLAEVVHSDAELTADAFDPEARVLLGELIDMGWADFDYMLETDADAIRARYIEACGEDVNDALPLLITGLLANANAISLGH